MRYIGVDLPRRLLVVCVVEARDGARIVVDRTAIGRSACDLRSKWRIVGQAALP